MTMTIEAAAQALREATRETVRRYSTWYLVQGVLMVIAGIVALLYPFVSSVALVHEVCRRQTILSPANSVGEAFLVRGRGMDHATPRDKPDSARECHTFVVRNEHAFLATSDPSVLKRILAYIRGLPCSLNIFQKESFLLIWSAPLCRWPLQYAGFGVDLLGASTIHPPCVLPPRAWLQ